jgi:hypothetical protein
VECRSSDADSRSVNNSVHIDVWKLLVIARFTDVISCRILTAVQLDLWLAADSLFCSLLKIVSCENHKLASIIMLNSMFDLSHVQLSAN